MRIKEFDKRFAGHVPKLQGSASSYAVLVPLVFRNGEAHLLFEVRSDSLGRQPGEVCFPGGRMEQGETPVQAALRETTEELSIPAEAMRPIAELDFLYHQSSSLIYPILGEIKDKDLKKYLVARKDDILAYFDYRYTNAFTESANNIIKTIEKQGHGYSFEVLRAMCLMSVNHIPSKVYIWKGAASEEDFIESWQF